MTTKHRGAGTLRDVVTASNKEVKREKISKKKRERQKRAADAHRANFQPFQSFSVGTANVY